jgi:citrate lyase subunit beta / citryl-CoA lyase
MADGNRRRCTHANASHYQDAITNDGSDDQASSRVTGILGSTEDMAADLGAPRSKTAIELDYARQRLHLECTAAGVLSVDCPYTFADLAGCEADARYARQLGYTAKSAVAPDHATIINRVMTPSAEEVRQARTIVEAFEDARAAGNDRAKHGDLLIEVPYYASWRDCIITSYDVTAFSSECCQVANAAVRS